VLSAVDLHATGRGCGAIIRALQIRARCETDELSELVDEMRLVAVARVGSNVHPVARVFRQAQRALQAKRRRELFRQDTNIRVERAAKVQRRSARDATLK
jgi:hypothetical protein